MNKSLTQMVRTLYGHGWRYALADYAGKLRRLWRPYDIPRKARRLKKISIENILLMVLIKFSLKAGASAAFTVDLIVYPLDTIKTRWQSRDFMKTYGSFATNKKLPVGTFRGLYQGVGSVIIATLPACKGILWLTSIHFPPPLSPSLFCVCAG